MLYVVFLPGNMCACLWCDTVQLSTQPSLTHSQVSLGEERAVIGHVPAHVGGCVYMYLKSARYIKIELW